MCESYLYHQRGIENNNLEMRDFKLVSEIVFIIIHLNNQK